MSPSPTVRAEIAGVELGCVLDTGAEASIIPSDVFHSKLETSMGNIDCVGTSMRIIGVTGTEVPVEGYIRARVRVEGREAVVGFLIVPRKHNGTRRQDFPVLLGCNALRALLQDSLPTASEFQFAQDCLNLSTEPKTTQIITESTEVTFPAKSVKSVRCMLNPAERGQAQGNLGWWLIEDQTWNLSCELG